MDYDQLAQELLDLKISSSQMRVHKRVSKVAKGELFVIVYLGRHGNVAYPKDISRAMDASTARIAAILNHLQTQGFITRTVDSCDNRQIIVTLTQDGVRRYEKCRADMLSFVKSMLLSMGEDDAREYVRLQKKLVQIIDTQNLLSTD